MERTGLDELLTYIDAGSCDYQEWCNVGMALKYEGYPLSVWEAWSQSDPRRYHSGECEKKWASFGSSAHEPVTGGTIVQMARDRGWTPARSVGGHELSWDDEIRDEGVVIDRRWLEGQELNIPTVWHPAQQLITYLETLFESTENVGYVVETFERDGRYTPKNKGDYSRTAGQLIDLLRKCGDDLGSVLGDYDPQAGAWIRFNPLDGNGVKDVNITDYRYALIESDSVDLEKQNAILRELELPIAALVYSGKKSLHAIVRVEAPTYEEYRRRVDYLYDVCRKNGLDIDRQNRNPSRLSRMPGVMRGDQKQYLLDTNIGMKSWDEWKEWIEGVNDDLPEIVTAADVWDHIPPLADPLIDGILRQGHKMLLAGPSKAGKSYALIELAIAIAEGKKWLGYQCTRGKVLYINLEVDAASCWHRLQEVYAALEITPEHLADIDIWNLRGKSVPMDKLAPKIIRRAAKKGYIAIIIDPIYKVITGDENSAEQMSHFCNQFDKVCNELGTAVIYCHHHSKGGQGDKRSMDRASGSGVFARDPDALLDMIELDVTDNLRNDVKNIGIIDACGEFLDRGGVDWKILAPPEIRRDSRKMTDFAREHLEKWAFRGLQARIETEKKQAQSISAWRIEATLREFPKPPVMNLWFKYPIHVEDADGRLQDLQAETAKGSPWGKNLGRKKTNADRKQERRDSLITAFSSAAENGRARVRDVCDYCGVGHDTVKKWVKENPDLYYVNDGVIYEAASAK